MSKYNPEIHHRKSIRLKEYDYSQEGMYFITICTKNRECILSQIECNNVGARRTVPRTTKNKIIRNWTIITTRNNENKLYSRRG